MKKSLQILPVIVAYFFVLLFIYASISKILDFENFQVQIAQSPLLSAYAGVISYGVIITELIIVAVLLIKKTRLVGLYASLGIMAAFTIYIYLILNFSEFVPCSCGGILEKMGWTEHLIFNIGCVVIGIISVLVIEKQTNYYLIRYLLRTGMVIILSCGLVTYLFYSSEYIIKQENNFTRRFLLHPIIEKGTYKLDDISYYFAGMMGDSIYLGNRQYPLKLGKLDTSLKKLNTVYIKLDQSNYSFKNINIKIKDSFSYIYDGSVPIIYRAKLNSNKAMKISYQDTYFNQLTIVDSVRFALRTQSSETKNFVLAELDISRDNKLNIFPDILQKQLDGIFDLDGNLLSDPRNSKLTYIYTYRNQFIVMDKQMSVLKELNTIDTISKARIKTVKLSNQKHKMTEPPLKVNLNAITFGGLLFNHSALMGKYESKESWKKADVIDVYSTNSKNYIGSFYIYKKKGQKLNGFYATDDYFYTIIDDNLTQYKLSTKISKYFKLGEAENPFKE